MLACASTQRVALDPADVGVQRLPLLCLQGPQLRGVLLLEQLLRLAGCQGFWVPFEQLVQLLVGEVPCRK